MDEKSALHLINQVYDLEKKILQKNETNLLRNINRMKDIFNDSGYVINVPLGEPFDETRTDCEASIAGDKKDGLVITEVLKPIVHKKEPAGSRLIQQAVVIVEGK